MDDDGATNRIMIVAADAGTKSATFDIDGAAVDDEFTHFNCTDARLVFVAVVNGQCARAIDGEFCSAVLTTEFNAFRGMECGAFAKVECDSADDGDARRDGHVVIYLIVTPSQCGRFAGDGLGDVSVVAFGTT